MLARASSALAGVSREQALVVAAFGVCVALLVTDNLSHGGRRRGGG
jgi:hypothetical protein